MLTNALKKVISTIVSSVLLLIMASFTSLPVSEADDIGQIVQKLSQGTVVPANELQAVGRIGGCTATLITQDLVLTAAHCVCRYETYKDRGKGCSTRATFSLEGNMVVYGL